VVIHNGKFPIYQGIKTSFFGSGVEFG